MALLGPKNPSWPRFASSAEAKEIEATHEWTLLGDNDTVAAGMHIRMDMTTGEKWVKLMDDDGNDDENTASRAKKPDYFKQVQISAHGDTESTTETSRKDGTEAPTPDTYDYDMMHRTLSNLPKEEIERMNLPVKPPIEDSLSPEARKIFEQRMKQIWEDRQKLLRDIELADLPLLLKDRIQAIREYLDDPATELLHIVDFYANDAAIETNEENGIIFVLKDLEYHLQDIDMTRDFITLGGWPLLSSLLHDDVHYSTVTISRTPRASNATIDLEAESSNTDGMPVDVTGSIDRVVSHAAWALGTAVKNTAEFSPLVTQKIQNNKVNGSNALELVVRQLQLSLQTQGVDQSNVLDTKVLRLLYCLGSFLRGNLDAQLRFGEIGGYDVLLKVLKDLVSAGDAYSIKLASRTINLATDIVVDATRDDDRNPNNQPLPDAILANAWVSVEWCSSLVSSFANPNLRESSLSAIEAFSGHCKAIWQESKTLFDTIERIRSKWDVSGDELDEVRNDRNRMIESIVRQLIV